MECFDQSRNLLSLAFVDKQSKADSTLEGAMSLALDSK
jgi:hypothetical protein